MSFAWIAEQRIEAAIEAGEFDNLPGAGLPLQLEDDSLIDPEWRLAHHLLRNAELAPAWVELDVRIRRELEAARRLLADIAARESEESPIWGRAVTVFFQRVEKINQQIELLNLMVPLEQFQRRRLDPAREVRRVQRGDPQND